MATLAHRISRGDAALAQSVRVWLVLVGYLAVVQLFITYIGAGLEQDPRSALLSWPAIGVIGAVGLIGVWLSHQTGFPAAGRVPPLALGIGLALGLAMAGGDVVFGWTRAFAAQNTLMSFNAPFPGSVLFYPAGAIVVDVFYRLLPIPLVLWLLRGHFQTAGFYVLAVLTSLIEPVQQDLDDVRPETLAMVSTMFALDFALNFSQAMFFRRYGFLASIALRMALYLVWHVAYGNLVCHC
jgi:hypothetical protein